MDKRSCISYSLKGKRDGKCMSACAVPLYRKLNTRIVGRGDLLELFFERVGNVEGVDEFGDGRLGNAIIGSRERLEGFDICHVVFDGDVEHLKIRFRRWWILPRVNDFLNNSALCVLERRNRAVDVARQWER